MLLCLLRHTHGVAHHDGPQPHPVLGAEQGVPAARQRHDAVHQLGDELHLLLPPGQALQGDLLYTVLLQGDSPHTESRDRDVHGGQPLSISVSFCGTSK